MHLRTSFRHNLITTLAVLIICCAGFACGGPPAARSTAGSTRSTFEADRPYDDAPLTEAELSGNSRVSPQTRTEPANTGTPSASTSRTVRGYRVQVHSFKDRSAAEAAASQLRRRFGNLNARVHIDHDPPYYKVRVGDFRSKAEAARLLKQLKSRREYRDAWVVEAMVTL